MSHSLMSCHWIPGRYGQHLPLHFLSSGSSEITPHHAFLQTKQTQCPWPLGVYLLSTCGCALCKQRRANTKASSGRAFTRLLTIWAAAPSQGQDFVLPLLRLLLWQGVTLVSCTDQHQIVAPGKRRDLRAAIAPLHQAVRAGRRAGPGAWCRRHREEEARPEVMSGGSGAGSGGPQLVLSQNQLQRCRFGAGQYLSLISIWHKQKDPSALIFHPT